MNSDNIHVYELRQDVIHNLQILWRSREESPAIREPTLGDGPRRAV